ncbi:MAG: helix-turn-helix transcriptional regulator [Okeania sp. SIO2C9]|uniref:hypothetical protein n=1 Tax=Okeania sp. SIO2C9 TaxID=2607791 RepID=UPI0013C0A008|nr:hypothetical protein [Okeania sp. SIO2C9]NEQ74894.1 helix-turn-helix transcriptional regulator [Okeania sp. SIO2C9]
MQKLSQKGINVIEETIKEKKITYKELARYMFLEERQLRRYLKGENNIDIDRLVHLLQRLDLLNKYTPLNIHSIITDNYQKKDSDLIPDNFELITEWIAVNHSKYEIMLNKVDELTEAVIKTHVCEFKPNSLELGDSELETISRIDEESGTLNFKLCFFSNQYSKNTYLLLRYHKRIKDEATLRVLQYINKYIYDEKVFADSDLAECLCPIEISPSQVSGLATYCKINSLEDKGTLIEYYKFALDVSHYTGETVQELISFAYQYGKLQKSISSLPQDLDITELSRNRPAITFHKQRIEAKVKSLLERIKEIRDDDIMMNKPSIKISQNDESFFIFIWNEIKEYIEKRPINNIPLLHDCHPHNTFFRNGQCLLIYDYEAVSTTWSPLEAIAFVMHRFIREFYVKKFMNGENVYPLREEIYNYAEKFLQEYQKGEGPIPVDFTNNDNLLKNIHLGIKLTNFSKLVSIMRYLITDIKDPAGRPSNMLKNEYRKFCIFLREADRYFKFI